MTVKAGSGATKTPSPLPPTLAQEQDLRHVNVVAVPGLLRLGLVYTIDSAWDADGYV